jgi:hypothetical protein
MSAAVPVENGTITRTGRCGKPCALANAGHSDIAVLTAAQ